MITMMFFTEQRQRQDQRYMTREQIQVRTRASHSPTMGDDPNEHRKHDGDLAVAPAKPKLKRPPLYKVVLLNDDYTPMEFVVEVLEHFFGLNRERATQVMLAVHTLGKGVCGIYSKDIAETKAAQVNKSARENGHPLLCEVEPSEDEE